MPVGQAFAEGDPFAILNGGKGQGTVTIPIRLDTFEVTVGRFRRFVAQYDGKRPKEGAGAHPKHPDSGWVDAVVLASHWPDNQAALLHFLAACRDKAKADVSKPTAVGWTDEPGASESYPMTCINYPIALAFCIWDGGRLPTMSEALVAYRGGKDSRPLPWGDDTPMDWSAEGFALVGTPPFVWKAVGSHPKGVAPFGHQDLFGSAAEVLLDRRGVTEPGLACYPETGCAKPCECTCEDCVSSWPTSQYLSTTILGIDSAGWTPQVNSTPVGTGTDASGILGEEGSPLTGFRCARQP